MNIEYDSEEAERQDVEQLCYLGLRTAFGEARSRRALRALARSCAERKFRYLNLWVSNREFHPVKLRAAEHLHAALAEGRGVIVCTPHVGFYQRIPLALVEEKLPVTMLLDTANFEREKSKLTYWEKRFAGQVPMRYINAELPSAAWEMARDLRAGRILFIWSDGNTGLGKIEHAKTVVAVSFCGLNILVRKGLAYLSAWTDAPVVNVMAEPHRRKITEIRFEPAIHCHENEPVDDYCHRVLQQLYSTLENYVRRDPACWEEWYHLRLWQVPENSSIQLPAVAINFDEEDVLQLVLAVDSKNVEYLKMVQGMVLTHVRTGDALLMTEPVRALVRAFTGQRTINEVLNKLARKYDEGLLLNSLHALCAGGFVLPLERPTGVRNLEFRPAGEISGGSKDAVVNEFEA